MTIKTGESGNRYCVNTRMEADGVRALWQRMRRGTEPFVFNVEITAEARPMGLKRINPQPFSFVVPKQQWSFDEYLAFVEQAGAPLLRAWLVARDGEKIKNELVMSPAGVCLDGKVSKTASLSASLDLVRAQDPNPFTEGQYPAGALVLGTTCAVDMGIEVRPFPVSQSWDFLRGAITADEFEGVFNSFVQGPVISSLMFSFPTLSRAARQMLFWREKQTGLFSYNCFLEEVSPKIEQNLLLLLQGTP